MKTIVIRGDIEADLTAKAIEKQLLTHNPNEEIDLLINSAGGSWTESIAVVDLLRGFKINEITLSGICASAATRLPLCLENQKTRISEGTLFMTHLATWEMPVGGSRSNFGEKYKNTVKLLDGLDDEIIEKVNEKLKVKVEDVEERIIDEWWMTASDCVYFFGFEKTNKRPEKIIINSLLNFKNMPKINEKNIIFNNEIFKKQLNLLKK